MPTQSVVGWWHTTKAINQRSKPNDAPRYVEKVQPAGHNFWARTQVNADGRWWLLTNLGNYYAKQYCARGKVTRPVPAPQPGRPGSPTPGTGPGYAYGIRDRRYKAGFHTGQDYPARYGARIVAVVGGKVINTSWGGAYGNWTLIRGTDGHTWLYAHQSRRAVSVGQHVKRGQTIGYVGSSGNVTGPHLHLEKSKGSTWSYGNVTRPTW